MGVLEQITQMKNQGMAEDQIIQELQEQGVSPQKINDALNQSQIKKAVSDYDNSEEYSPSADNPEIAPPIPQEESPSGYYQQTKDISEQSYAPFQEDQNQYPQTGYENYAGYQEEAGGSYSDTVIEISEQVFSEKIKKIQKQIDGLNEFKALAETKIKSSESSLKRIESILDKLQIAILERIGSYGKNLEGIKKEMSMMQDSFGKIINPVLDKKTHPHMHSSIPPPHKAPLKRKASRKK